MSEKSCVFLFISTLCVIIATHHEVNALPELGNLLKNVVCTLKYNHESQKIDYSWSYRCSDSKRGHDLTNDELCDSWKKFQPCKASGEGSVCKLIVKNEKNGDKFCSKAGTCDKGCDKGTECTDTTLEQYCTDNPYSVLCKKDCFSEDGKVESIATCQPPTATTTTTTEATTTLFTGAAP